MESWTGADHFSLKYHMYTFVDFAHCKKRLAIFPSTAGMLMSLNSPWWEII